MLVLDQATGQYVPVGSGSGGGNPSAIAALQAQDILHGTAIAQNGTDVSAVDVRVDAVVATNTTQGVAIAGKQDQLSASTAGISLLNGTTVKALQAGSGVTLSDQTSHIVVSASGGGGGSSLTAAAPITLASGVIGLDMASSSVNIGQCFVSTDLECHDFTCNGAMTGAGRVLINDYVNAAAAEREPVFDVSADLEKVAGTPPTLGLTSSYKAGVLGDINAAVTAGVATREPVFSTTADLTKVLNLGASPPTIELGISSILEARIVALEAAINPFFCAGVLYPSGAIRVSKGRVGFTVTTAGGGADYTITFAQSYGSLNYVAVCCSSQWHDIVGNRTATGFTLYVRGSTNQNVNNADISFIVI